MSIIEKVRGVIDRYDMLRPGDRVMVALSGGADSVCLLHLLLELRDELGISLCAAHLNHMLRGEEGEKDARFAAALAEDLGVPCAVGSADVRAYAKKRKKVSIQQAARELRYGFLGEKADRMKADKVATGHNADDQAETIIMNFLRGAGVNGLGGIPPVRDGVYIRPLIEVKRKEIEGYLEERKVEYATDPSNYKTHYLRNRIRLELIPHLQRRYNPRLVDRLVAMGDILREERHAVEGWMEEIEPRLVPVSSPDRAEMDIAALMELPLGLRRRAVRSVLRGMGAGPACMDSAKLAALERLLVSRKSGKSLRLAGDLKVAVEFDRLVVHRVDGEEGGGLHAVLEVPGATLLPGGDERLVAEIDEDGPFILHSGLGREASLDYDKLCGAPTVRNRRPGDRFSPLGMEGSKKLKDYLIELRVPVSKRDRVLLVTDDEGILWVVEGRVSERAKVTSGTRRVLQLKLVK